MKQAPLPYRAWSRASAVVGGGAWLIVLVGLPASSPTIALIERLLLLAVLVFAPLALPLTVAPAPSSGSARLYSTICHAQPLAAILTAGAFFLPAGLLAAALASSWLLFSALVALFGLSRLLTRRAVRAHELCVDAGLLFLPIGATWLAAARLGANPLGFGDTIVLLTAVHFHYAGFTGPILAGMIGRTLAGGRPLLQRAYRLAAVGIIVGVPLVALGITFSRVLEIAAVFVLAGSLVLLALLCIAGVLPRLSSRPARSLLTISALAAIWTTLLAAGYASGGLTGYAITIPQMVLAHGLVNAFGLVLCGLLAWTIELSRVTSKTR